MAEDTRDKMIIGAAGVLAQRGLQGASFSEVIEVTGAPRGSIYHHFPGGKDEMIAEAICLLGSSVAERIRATDATKPEQVSDEFTEGWREFARATDLKAVCAVSAATVGAGADAQELLPAVASTFASWQDALAEAYARTGVTKADSKRLAITTVAALEGALILARAQQSLEPFDAVQRDLAVMAKAAGKS